MRGGKRSVAGAEDAEFVAEDQIAHAETQELLGNGGPGCACAADNALDGGDVLFHDFERVEQRSRHTDGGAVLVIVEYGDVADLFELSLDFEAARCGDVL